MKYRATTTTLVRAEPSEHALDMGSVEKNVEFEGTADPLSAWVHVERPFSGWVARRDCEEVADAREAVERDGFVQRCVIAEWTFNAADGIAPWLVVADYLIARAIIETDIENAGPAPGSDAVGPLRVTSGEWNDFLGNGGVLAAGCTPAQRHHPIAQVDGAAFRMHRDAKRLSELGIAAGKATASDPFIPTLLEVLLAYLTDSPEAALALMDAHAREPNLPVDQVLAPPLVPPDLLDMRARFFRAAGTPKSVRAVVGGSRALLEAALEQAAREIERHMPEAAPQIGEDSAAPWLEVAEAAKGAGVDEREPRFKAPSSTISTPPISARSLPPSRPPGAGRSRPTA